MKRKYIAPATLSFEVHTTGMLALSKQSGTKITDGNKDQFEQYSNRNSGIWDNSLWDSK